MPGQPVVVSVVIAAFNGAAVLGEQLTALAAERVDGDCEVVVADNGSSDGTGALVDGLQGAWPGHGSLRLVDASSIRGQAHARNVGAAAATGDHLVFLDQDDLIQPGYLAAMSAALDVMPAAAARMATSALNAGWVAGVRTVDQATQLPTVFGAPWGYGGSLAVRRDVFEAVDGFDERCRGAGEDVDFCLRLGAAGFDLGYVPDAVLEYRFPASLGGLWRQGRTYGRAHVELCRRTDRTIAMTDAVGWLRPLLGGVWWAMPSRSKARRGRGLFTAGRHCGLLLGVLRHPRVVRRRAT